MAILPSHRARPERYALRRHAWRALAWTALAAFGWTVLAYADDSVPAGGGALQTGTAQIGTLQTGDLHDQIAAAFAAGDGTPPVAAGTGRNWTVTPAISLQQEWTDNALQTPGLQSANGQLAAAKPQASFITVLMPSLAISANTSRITATIDYAPSLYEYTSVQGQNRIAQNLDADVLLALVPDQLFLDLRGFAAEQSLAGGSGPAGTTALSSGNAVQSDSFSASPYLNHRFGGWGTAQIGASLSETSQGAVAGSLAPGAQAGGATSQNLVTRQEFASFASGENFGRLLSNVTLSASQSDGTGALQGSYRDIATYQAGYAITHGITALASIGWEDILYGPPDALHIDDATWSVGVKLTPHQDSTIIATYGHEDGETAASLNANYALTARTRLSASYSDTVSTDTEQLQTALANTQLDALGNPVNAQTGAPLLLTDNFFGVNTGVLRIRNASLTAAWLLDRDAVEITVNYQRQTPIGTITGTGAATGIGGETTLASNGAYGSVAWQHDLSDVLKANLFFQYGKLTQAASTGRLDTDVLVGTAALTYQFSETMSGSFEYSYTSDSYTAQLPGTAANLVVLGLRKAF